MTLRKICRVTILLLLIVYLAPPALAQEATILQGSVADQHWALVVGALVSLDDGRGHKYTTPTAN